MRYGVVLFAGFVLACGSPQLQAQDTSKPPQDGKVRVLVTDSNSWQVSGGFAVSEGSGGGAISGGARPQTAEVIKTFNERCPEVTITMNKANAKYVILLDHEGGTGLARNDNKIAVFDREGDAVFSGSTRTLGNAVKDACTAIKKTLPR